MNADQMHDPLARPNLRRLAADIHGQVHAIEPAAADAVLKALEGRTHDAVTSFTGSPAIDRTGRDKGYRVTQAGTAIVPIVGELVTRGSWIGAVSGLTSYEALRQVLKAARDDAAVRAVVLDVDSPGGTVPGMFETATLVAELARLKPVVAIASPLAAASAYVIAAKAGRVVGVPDSDVGGVGVVYVHADRSMQLARQGIRVSVIQAGVQKTGGSSLHALGDTTRADIERQLDSVWSRMIAAISAARPRLTAQKLRAMQGRLFPVEQALEAGLVDGIAPFESVVEKLDRVALTLASSSPPAQALSGVAPQTWKYLQADLKAHLERLPRPAAALLLAASELGGR